MRAAIGGNGTAAVVTAVGGSQVVRVHGPSGGWGPAVPTPAGLSGPHIAVGSDGTVTAVGIVTSPTFVESLVAQELAPGATRVGAIWLAAGPGGDAVAAWTLSDGAGNVQGFAFVKPAGAP